MIGEGEFIAEREAHTGIELNRRCRKNCLTWANLDSDLVLDRATTKTRTSAAHDLKLSRLVIALLMQVRAARRIGPLIVEEMAGRSYAVSAYGASGGS